MEQNVANLGEAVEARRRELNMSQVDVWHAGGPSNSTLTGIENGTATSVSASTQRKLDHALGWEEGSSQKLLAGADRIRVFSIDGGSTPTGRDGEPDTVLMEVDRIVGLVRRVRPLRNTLAHSRSLRPEELDMLMRDALAIALEVEALAVLAIGRERLYEMLEGRTPDGPDLPPLQDFSQDPADYGLAARETPPGYRKGQPSPDE